MTAPWVILSTMSRSAGLSAAATGCYEAPRAAALSGVPVRTVYHWAATGLIVPSVSPVQEKLWSYADLMALRIVAWLRKPERPDDDSEVPKRSSSSMGQVRAALAILEERGLDLWTRQNQDDASPLLVDLGGGIHIREGDHFLDLAGNESFPEADWLDLLGPFDVAGHRGPNLLAPKPHLRIAPERVSGEPHVENTRLTTRTLAGMSDRGFSIERIVDMYDVSPIAVAEAVQLEAELTAA